MENLKKAIECLSDLIDLHQERISGYQNVLHALGSEENCLETLFTAFIKQSEGMKAELDREANEYGIRKQLTAGSGKFGLTWSVVKTVFNSRMPARPLDKCKSGENALLIAYHGMEGSEGLDQKMRELVKKQKREIIAARDWITHFESLLPPPKHPQNDMQLATAIAAS